MKAKKHKYKQTSLDNNRNTLVVFVFCYNN